jgi:hypothetical protein
MIRAHLACEASAGCGAGKRGAGAKRRRLLMALEAILPIR